MSGPRRYLDVQSLGHCLRTLDLFERNSAREPTKLCNHIRRRPVPEVGSLALVLAGSSDTDGDTLYQWRGRGVPMYVSCEIACLDELNLDLYSETDFETESPQPQPSYAT